MSKIALSPNASGTGVFTIASPSGNTDRTLTLPDEAGTVLTSAGVPASAMPAGSVLQVVFDVDNAEQSYAFSSTQATGFPTVCQVTITPISTNSKILIFAEASISGPSASGFEAAIRVTRNGAPADGLNTTPTGGVAKAHSSGGPLSSETAETMTVSLVDSPATTSALTYRIEWIGGEAVTYFVNRSYGASQVNYHTSGGSRLICMEIGG